MDDKKLRNSLRWNSAVIIMNIGVTIFGLYGDGWAWIINLAAVFYTIFARYRHIRRYHKILKPKDLYIQEHYHISDKELKGMTDVQKEDLVHTHMNKDN